MVVVLRKRGRKHSQSLKVSSHLFSVSRALWWDQRDLQVQHFHFALCRCCGGAQRLGGLASDGSGELVRGAADVGLWSLRVTGTFCPAQSL